MTTRYTREANALGRIVQWLVEIDLDRCTNTYGVAPCTAADLGDGLRCSYSFQTCQDPDNFARGARTYRFCLNDVPWSDPAVQVWPLLQDIAGSSQKIEADRLVTYPEKLTLTFVADWAPPPVDHDKGAGKFNTARAGEFWRNLFSRNRNYPNRKVRLYRGFYAPDMELADFARVGPEYVIREVQHDRTTCRVTIESPLVKLNERTAPAVASETNTLQVGIDNVATTLSVADASEYPDPTAYTRNSIFVRVESEIMRVTARDTALNQLTVERGRAGTTAVAHVAAKKVESYTIFGTLNGASAPTGRLVTDVLLDILEWAGVDSADIDAASFTALAEIYSYPDTLFQFAKSRRLSELAHTLREPRGILLYMNPAGKFAVRVMAPWTSLTVIDDTLITTMEGETTLSVKEDEESRITAVELWYGPTKDGASRDPADYSRGLVYRDADLEAANNYGEPKVQVITDAGLAPDIAPLRAANLARRLVSRKRAGVRTISFVLDIREAALDVGDGILVQSKYLLGPDGQMDPRPCIVVERTDVDPLRVRYVAADSNLPGRFFRIGPDTMGDTYDDMTEAERQQYGAWGDANNRVGSQKAVGYSWW